MYILFYQFQFAGKARLSFAEHNVEFVCLRILQQANKFRALSIRAGVIIVAVYVIKLPSLPHSVLQQHGLLILYAAAIIRFKLLVSIFFG